jgi:hypothetical protein
MSFLKYGFLLSYLPIAGTSHARCSENTTKYAGAAKSEYNAVSPAKCDQSTNL